jgi:hypothetical protein
VTLPKNSQLRHFDITWGVQGPVGVRRVYIHGQLHTRGFSYHVEWSSIICRFGNLYTYHNLPVESPEARSQAGKATLLATPA